MNCSGARLVRAWRALHGQPPTAGQRARPERHDEKAEAAHHGPVQLILTARAENHLHDHPDLADTITRLQAYQAAGADVLYAPGLTRLDDVRRVVSSLDRPVNVLARPGVPPVPELAAAGVARVSVGGIKPGVVLIAGGAIVARSWEGGDIACRRGGRWSQVVAVISRVPTDFSWRLRTEALRLRDAAAYRDRLRSALTDAGRGVRCRERVADFAGRDGADARERPR